MYCYAECRYAECRYDECRYTEWRYAECRHVEYRAAVNYGSKKIYRIGPWGRIHFTVFYLCVTNMLFQPSLMFVGMGSGLYYKTF